MTGVGKEKLSLIRKLFRQVRQQVIKVWRLGFMVPRLLRHNPYTGFFGRKLFQYVPFFLPHDKSYYGFAKLVHSGNGLFLDIGANDGISAIGFHHIHNDYQIISIEPNPIHQASLERLKRKLKGFDYHLIGAGRSKTEITLYIPLYRGVPIYTAASMNKDFVIHSMTAQHLHGEMNKSIMIVEYKVVVVPLDDLGLSPDIIKIDTEGFDYEVLLGLQGTIIRCRPAVMVEHNPELVDKIEAYFRALDYSLLTYDPKHDEFKPFDRKSELRIYQDLHVTTNIFCVPQELVQAKGLLSSQKRQYP